jgi:hypothetical protein
MFGFFSKKLPHCDELFVKYLAPWYPEEDRPKMTRPDMYVINGFDGSPIDLVAIQYLPPEILDGSREQINSMVEAATQDFQHILKFDRLDLNIIDAVDKHFDRTRIASLLKESDPEDFGNPYMVSVCEFGATLGHLFAQFPDFGWLYSYPYYHSIIVHKESGYGITVFDWAVKKFSEYGVDDGFADKFQKALDIVRE